MTAKILDGRAIAKSLRAQILRQTQKLSSPPGLAVIVVGDDAASHIYVKNKRKACAEVGIHSRLISFKTSISQATLLAQIATLNEDTSIHGILVQLPLPKHIDVNAVIDEISPHKDVDGFHPYNLGRLAQRRPLLRPCTPYGIILMLRSINFELMGAEATVVGVSNIVGRPMSLELLLARSTVNVVHSKTRDIRQHVESAELLIVGVGKPGLISGEWIKPGAVVVDVGINRLDNGKLVGDVNFDAAKERAAWITPVPGGVGPMTVTSLLQNTLTAYQRIHP